MKLFFLLNILSLISLLPLFNQDFWYFCLVIPAIIFIIVNFLFPFFPLYLMFGTVFTGTILSFDIGFTLKASQLFALIFLFNILIKKLKPSDSYEINDISTKDILPFLVFFIAILPSLFKPDLFSELFDTSSSIRYLFNLIFLFLIYLAIITGIDSKEKLKNSLICCFFSFISVLTFGFFQQTGYYLNIYDPFEYVGKHSVFVDFYGPFLRISPGSFANEFGEILQSVGIFIIVFLIFSGEKLKKTSRFLLQLTILLITFSLIINFTRISWIIYFISIIFILFLAKKYLSLSFIMLFSGLLFYYLSQETDIALIFSVLERINELSDFSGNSIGLRFIAWEESYGLFTHSPFIGNGLGTTIETHNVPLELLSETGILGFIGFYLMVIFLLQRFIFTFLHTNDLFIKNTLLAVIISFIGCLIFDFTNHGIYHFIFWLIIGLGISCSKISEKESKLI